MLDKENKALRLLMLNERFDDWCAAGRKEDEERYTWVVARSIEMAEALATKAANSSSFYTAKKEDLIGAMRLEIPLIMRKYEKDPTKRSVSTSKKQVSAAPTKYTSYLTQQLKFVIQKFRRSNYSPLSYTAQSYETLESLLTYLNRYPSDSPVTIGSTELFDAARLVIRISKTTGAPTLTRSQYNDACDLYFKTHNMVNLEAKEASRDEPTKVKPIVIKARFDGSADTPTGDEGLAEWLIGAKARLKEFKEKYEEGSYRPTDLAKIIGCEVNDISDYYDLLLNSGIDWDI